ncbi:uncharacterized protein LOC120674706 [Panicum virgatum]|uniref:uncharacterized protein LOC120674706 n=1 Tax=Panicum virgatum TaxID=38727 RepID=UPI0019D561BB|nr:uncharacterized protein LOC120674706 [Panicum virgatum]
MRLDTFDGSGTPTDAADWLRKMEKVMAACRMTAEEIVLFIPHQLTGQVDVWWVGVCDAWTPARGAITWEVFLAQFRVKYYSDSFRDKMNDALNHIQQGDKTVDEYERDFSNTIRFVPSVASDEREKARKFFTGLNARYREVMGRNPPTTSITAVEEARGMEIQFQLTMLQQRRNGNSTDFEQMDILYCYAGVTEAETRLILSSAIPERVLEAQQQDRLLLDVRKRIHEGKVGDFTLDASGAVRFRGRLCVPQKSQVKEDILKEAHRTRYTVHPGENKMYQDLKKTYWWKRMKIDVAKYVASCGICQRVKAEHKSPAGKLQSLEVLMWPWDDISMDFVVHKYSR